MKVSIRGLFRRRSLGNPVISVPANAFEEVVSERDEGKEAKAKSRSDDFDRKLQGARSKMNGKGKKAKKSHGFLITVRNWAIGIGLVIYAYLFLQFGPILLGCTLALVVVGGLVFLFFKFRPKDDTEEGE